MVKISAFGEGGLRRNVHNYSRRTRESRKRIASFQEKMFPRRYHRRFKKEGILRIPFRKEKKEIRGGKKTQELIENTKVCYECSRLFCFTCEKSRKNTNENKKIKKKERIWQKI